MRRRAHLLFLCLLLVSPVSLFAQSTNATITGTVNDSTHHLIPDADIQIVNDATGLHYSAKTNRDGIYNVSVLPPGKYTAQAARIGFKTIVTPNIILNVRGAVALNFVLPIGATSETLTVEAGTTLLNTTDASVSTVIDQQFIANMPLNGRSLQSLMSLTPGVTQTPIQYGSGASNSGEFAINGQRTEGNYYTVDGVSATIGVSTNSIYSAGASGGVPNETALGTTQSIASLDALQEFRISTSTYSAEYGRTPGGQIALQTRSGTNLFHGSVFDYFRNDALDANNWFNDHVTPQTAKTAERQNDFGGTFSGPLLIPHVYRGIDRTFFFYSYEALRLRVPTPATTIQVPDASLRAATPVALQPFVNAFPVPNGAEVSGTSGLAYFTGAYSLPSGLDTNSIRLDHHLGDKTQIFARYFNSSSQTQTRSSSNLSQLATTRFVSRGITAGLTQTLTEHLFNEARYNYTWNATQYNVIVDGFGGAQSATLSTYLTSSIPKYSQLSMYLWWGTHPNLTIAAFDIGQTQTNIVDTFQYQHGKHLLRFGGDYRRLELNNGANQYAAVLLYTSTSNVTNNSASYGNIRTDGIVPAAPIFTNLSLFAQDEWKILPSTSLSLGLRWDVNPPPTNGSGRIPPTLNEYSDFATATLLPEGTPLWNTDYRGIAPRFGAATQLNSTKGRETVLRYGIGVFFDTGNTATSQGFNLLGLGAYRTVSQVAFPLPSSFYVVPTASTATPYNNAITAFNRNLRLPLTYEWNVSLEQALSAARSFTVGYVAAAARRLLNGTYKNPSSLNTAFSNGYGVYVFDNGPRSNYQSLQAQFQQRVTHGLQALAAITWSHSVDDSSTNFISYQPLLKGDSDFDIRTNAQVALTYQIPGIPGPGFLRAVTANWGLDLRAFARTAPPVDVFGSEYVASDGSEQYSRPNVVTGTPLYVYGDRSLIPGGKKLNYSAFQDAGSAIGNAPRNFLRGFGAGEIDFAARREFAVGERCTIQARAEAFNISNHPDFGAIYNSLSYGATQFGQAYNTLNVGLKNQSSLYQQGGPRSLQLALKVLF